LIISKLYELSFIRLFYHAYYFLSHLLLQIQHPINKYLVMIMSLIHFFIYYNDVFFIYYDHVSIYYCDDHIFKEKFKFKYQIIFNILLNFI